MSARLRVRAGRAGALLVIGLLEIGSPRAALAQSADDVETARACFLEGSKVASEGRWKEARELYARSLQLRSAPITRYSLGVAEQETGHLADALASFRSFLSQPLVPGTARYVESARTAIVALEARVGRVTIAVDPRKIEGLAMAIDGQPIPPAPDTARDVDPGAHEVSARAPGFHPATGRFNVSPGGTATVSLAMIARAAIPTTHEIAAPTNHDVADAKPATTPILAPAPRSGPRSSTQKLPIVLIGAGGALLLSGIIVGMVGVNEASNAPTRDGAMASGAQAKAIAGDLLGGAGIAAAGVGLIFLLSHDRSTRAPAFARSPAMTSAGAGLQMHF